MKDNNSVVLTKDIEKNNRKLKSERNIDILKVRNILFCILQDTQKH